MQIVYLLPVALLIVSLLSHGTKKNIIKRLSLIIVSLLFIESFANCTNLFLTDLNVPITLDKEVTAFLEKNNIPKPIFKKNRFWSVNGVNINDKLIILPFDYTSFSKSKINYITLKYIESNLIDLNEYNQIQEDKRQAELEGRKVLQTLVGQKLKAKVNNNKERISKIQAQGGLDQCNFSFSKVAMECTFVTKEELNYDIHQFWNAATLRENLDKNFTVIANNMIKDKHYYEHSDYWGFIFIEKELF